MAYTDLSNRVTNWDDVEITMKEIDMHHVLPTLGDYTRVGPCPFGAVELYIISHVEKKFWAHLGAERYVCKAFGWTFNVLANQQQINSYLNRIRNGELITFDSSLRNNFPILIAEGEKYVNNIVVKQSTSTSRTELDQLRVVRRVAELQLRLVKERNAVVLETTN
jgi:hypothetical protein